MRRPGGSSLRGFGQTARAELTCCVAELAWRPTALLPSRGGRWTGADAHRAKATLVDGPLAAKLPFRCGAAGPIESVAAEARGALVGGRTVMLSREGRWSDHETHGGMQLPMRGRAARLKPEGWRVYFDGSVSSIEHAPISVQPH